MTGFRFTLCFKGEEAAKDQAAKTMGNVLFWKDSQRMIAVPASDGVAAFPFEHKDDVSVAMRTVSFIKGEF